MAQGIYNMLTTGATGGISDDKFAGITSSFQDIQNIEFRKNPKSVKLQNAMVKDSSDVVVDLLNDEVTISSNGNMVAFGNLGNIYVKPQGGSRQKVYTMSGGSAIMGAVEYNQYIYRATLDKLHRTDITSISVAINTGTLTPTDINRKTLQGLTYSNALNLVYTTDSSTKLKVGDKIYAKTNYSLTDVGVSSGTTAPTKAYLQEAPDIAAIAFNSQRLYTSANVNPTDLTVTPTRVERQPLGDADVNWNTAAISADNQIMYVCGTTTNIWKSTNGGVNRTEIPNVSSNVTEVNNAPFSIGRDPGDVTSSLGVKVQAILPIQVNSITCSVTSTPATRCRIYNSTGTLLSTATITAGVATLPSPLTFAAGDIFRIETDKTGSIYRAQRTTNPASFPQSTSSLTRLSGSNGGADDTTYPWNIQSISIYPLLDKFDNLSCSADGVKVIASKKNGRIYRSSDSGATWSETQPAGDVDADRRITKVSGDGSAYLAGAYEGRIYKSTNGTSRTEIQPDGNYVFKRASGDISYDGTAIIIGRIGMSDPYRSYDGKVYYSSNSGTSRTAVISLYYGYPGFSAGAPSVAIGGDNRILYACTYDSLSAKKISISYDSGTTWGDYTVLYPGVYASTDFNGIEPVYTDGKRIYKSLDGGTNYTELQPAGNVDKTRNGIVLSPGAIPLQTVNVSAGKATFSTTLTAGKYYNILFDNQGSSWDARYKATTFPATKTDINYLYGMVPWRDSTNGRVITSIGTAVANAISHPMVTSNNFLYIGDGNFLAQVDPYGVFTPDRLTFPDLDKIYDITYNNAYLRFYCDQGTNTDAGIAYFWDGVQDNPDQKQSLPGKYRCSTIKDNIDYAIMGFDPVLYYYPYQRQPLKRIYNLNTGINSMINFKNYLLFGTDGGVYSRGNYHKDYPEVLNVEYKTSNLNDTDTIGCIFNANGDLYISRKNGTTYGIDKLDTSKYTTQGWLTSRVYYGTNMRHNKNVVELYMTHEPLKANEIINVYTRRNLDGARTLQATFDETNGNVYHNKINFPLSFNELEVKLELLGPGTTTPEVYECLIRVEEQES